MSDVNEIRQYTERNDEALIDLILSGEERQEPRLDVGLRLHLGQGAQARLPRDEAREHDPHAFRQSEKDVGKRNCRPYVP